MATNAIYADRVKDTTTTTGTGDVTLAGSPPTGYQAFSSAFATGQWVTYCIADQSGANWEVGLCPLSTSTTLQRSNARAIVYASSNSGALVNFSAGTKDAFVPEPAWALNSAFGRSSATATGMNWQ